MYLQHMVRTFNMLRKLLHINIVNGYEDVIEDDAGKSLKEKGISHHLFYLHGAQSIQKGPAMRIAISCITHYYILRIPRITHAA